MKLKSAVLLAFALCCGLVAMLGVQQLASQKGQAKSNMRRILVASEDIDAGIPLQSEMVSFAEWPADAVPQGAIFKKEDFEECALKVPLLKGDIILKNKLGEKGQMGASMAIPLGYRMISIPVNETKTNSGQLRAGDRVDILVTYKAKGNSTTKTLLEYIEVFSIGNVRIHDDAEGGSKTKNVALLLTPEQTQIVRLADSLGELDLATRNKNDTEIVNSPEMIDSLLNEMNGSLTVSQDSSKPKYEQPTQVTQQEVVPPVVVQTEKPTNSGSVMAFLNGLSESSLFKTKEEVTPDWNVVIYDGDETHSTIFEKYGKEKNEWRQKVQVEETPQLSAQDYMKMNQEQEVFSMPTNENKIPPISTSEGSTKPDQPEPKKEDLMKFLDEITSDDIDDQPTAEEMEKAQKIFKERFGVTPEI